MPIPWSGGPLSRQKGTRPPLRRWGSGHAHASPLLLGTRHAGKRLQSNPNRNLAIGDWQDKSTHTKTMGLKRVNAKHIQHISLPPPRRLPTTPPPPLPLSLSPSPSSFSGLKCHINIRGGGPSQPHQWRRAMVDNLLFHHTYSFFPPPIHSEAPHSAKNYPLPGGTD